ncbi:MAG: hypothetical protein H8D67_17400 [Deltaproteobacteria bacterium]|nr:hypothetical protein [Deltaproteobacteria bacterium]
MAELKDDGMATIWDNIKLRADLIMQDDPSKGELNALGEALAEAIECVSKRIVELEWKIFG